MKKLNSLTYAASLKTPTAALIRHHDHSHIITNASFHLFNRMHFSVGCRSRGKSIGLSTFAIANVLREPLRENQRQEEEETKGIFDGCHGFSQLNERCQNNILQGFVGVEYDVCTRLLEWCVASKALEEGKQVHAHIIIFGFETVVFVGNNLVNMYVKCEKTDDARQVFDKMTKRKSFTWTAMITGYAQNGPGEEALKLYWRMQRAGMNLTQFTFAAVVKASASIAALEQGKQVHCSIVKTGFDSDVFVGSSLVDMYAKCGIVNDARQVFNKMPERDLVSWSGMIAGYALNGQDEDALKLFWEALMAGLKPNDFTFSSIFRVCGNLATLEQGRQLHSLSIKSGFESYTFVGSSLVGMYAKCGSIENARQVFDKMSKRNVASWNAIIIGCAHHGRTKEAFRLFSQMLLAGMTPNDITFLCVLSACSHAGLVDEGRLYFDSMSRDHGITPRPEHYACIVDLLGHSGRLQEADDFIKDMPFEPLASVWEPLLGACKMHGNMELGKRVAEQLFEIDSQNSRTYILLSNIYAAAGRWDDVAKVRKMMKDRGVKKETGRSWIEVKNRVHTFVSDDATHPQMEEIYAKFNALRGMTEDAGYVPDTKFVLHGVE